MSTEKDQNASRVFFNRKNEDREFKLLSIIEDTILGLLEIFERVFRTIGIIIFQPKTLRDKVALPFRQTELVGPFTFLALSSFLVSLTLSAESVRLEDFMEEFNRNVEGISILSAIKLTFPLLLTKVFLSFALASLVAIGKGKDYRAVSFKLFCYWFGMVFFLYGLGVFLLAINQSEVIFIDLGSHIVFFSFFILLLLFVSFRVGGGVLERLRITRIRFLDSLFVGFGSFIVLLLVIAITLFVGVNQDDLFSWTTEDQEQSQFVTPKLSVWSSVVQQFEDQRVKMTFLVKNTSRQEVFLLRSSSENKVAILYSDCKSSNDCEQKSSRKHSFVINAWENGDESVLRVNAGETKWVEIIADVEDNIFDEAVDLNFNRMTMFTVYFHSLVSRPNATNTGERQGSEITINASVSADIWRGR